MKLNSVRNAFSRSLFSLLGLAAVFATAESFGAINDFPAQVNAEEPLASFPFDFNFTVDSDNGVTFEASDTSLVTGFTDNGGGNYSATFSRPGVATIKAIENITGDEAIQTFGVIATDTGANTQTITLDDIGTDGVVGYFEFGDQSRNVFTLNATASSGRPVTFTYNNLAAGEVSNGTLTLNGTGELRLGANQKGSITFAAAPDALQIVEVLDGQEIEWPQNFSGLTYAEGRTLDLTAKSVDSAGADTDLAVSYEIINGDDVVSLTGSTLTFLSSGAVTIRATQSGGTAPDTTEYAPAESVDRTFSIGKGTQTITFFGELNSAAPGSISNKTVGGDDFVITASADSGIPPQFSVTSILPAGRPQVTATVSNNTVTLTTDENSTAQVTITATFSGSDFTTATATRTFEVRLNQDITFQSFNGLELGQPAISLTGSSTSLNPVEYAVINGPATVLGTPPATQRLAMFGTGVVTLQGSADAITYDGDNDTLYNSVTESTSFVIGGVEPTSGPGFLDLWTWRNPAESSTDFFNDVTVGLAGDELAAVGTEGTIFHSTDGTTWTEVDADPAYELNSIASSPVRYAAVGSANTIRVSTDGTTWTDADSGLAAGNTLTAVGYGGNLGFVAAASDGTATSIIISGTGADGTWTQDLTYPNYMDGGSAVVINRITYSSALDVWILVGDNGLIVTLDDDTGAYNLKRLGTNSDYFGVHALDDGRVFIVGEAGNVLSSSDVSLDNWDIPFSGTDYDLYDVFSGNGYLVVVGEDGRVLTSFEGDGTLWTESVSRFPLDMRGLAYYEGIFIAAGQNQTILTSAIGLEWTQRIGSNQGNLNDLAGTASATVAVGDGGLILRSTDGGDSWSEVTPAPTGENLNGVLFSDGQFVAVGDSGTILLSTDGLSWTVPAGGVPVTTDLLDVTTDGTTFVIVGRGFTILSSTDADNWILESAGSTAINAVSYINNRFVAVGDNGNILTSNNGTDWNEDITSGTNESLYGIGAGDSGDRINFVAVGANGTILTSLDSLNWTRQISSYTDDLNDILFQDGVYVAVGARYSFVASENGTDWASQVSGSLNDLNAVAFIDDTFISVGDYGAILTADSVLPTGLDSWLLRNPLASGENIHDVVYGNNSFVAVGDNGTVLVSTDGESWSKVDVEETIDGVSQPLTADLKGVAYGNGIYMAVGGNRILSSTNAQSWQVLKTWTSDLLSISFGDGVFVATGDARSILYTLNNTQWFASNLLGTGQQTGAAIYDAVFSEALGLWVAVGDPADGIFVDGEERTMTQVYSSPNGISWTRHLVPRIDEDAYYTGSMRTVSAGKNSQGLDVFRAFGHPEGVDNNDLVSADGSTWLFGGNEAIKANGSLYTEGNGQAGFIYVGELGAIEGVDPGFISFPGVTETLNNIAFGNQSYVLVGNNGRILSSSDGRNWSVRSSSNLDALNAIVVDAFGKYVSVGNGGTLLSSEDSITWTPASSVPTGSASTAFNDVTFTDSNLFVAVGNTGSVLTSNDGDVWTAPSPVVTQNLHGVAFGNLSIVTVGESGAVATSPDGSNWTKQTFPTSNDLYDLIFANGQFMAVGASGTILTSTDGISWQTRTSGTDETLYGVGYGEDGGDQVWIAVGNGGTILASENNGASWTPVFSGTDNTLFGVSFGLGNFYVVGENGTGLTSNDGEEWFRRPTNTSYALNGATFFNGVFTAVGNFSTIITSGEIQPRIDQTILLLEISDKVVSDGPFELDAVATSDLPVSFTVVNGPATISGNTVTLTGSTGTVTIRATQAGNVRYNPATPVDQSFSVKLNNQAITFFGEPGSASPGSIGDKVNGGPAFTVSADTNSEPEGLFASISVVSGPATVSNTGSGTAEIELTGAGTVTLEATQNGNVDYNPATPVQRSFAVARGSQSIEFPSAGPFEVGDPNYTLQAEASSGLPISYAVISGPGAIVNGDQLQFDGSGTITVQASQLGNENYEPAISVTADFLVQPASAGSNWEGRTSPVVTNLLSVNFAGQQFLASGENSVIITSGNGTTWTPRAGGSGAISDIAFGGKNPGIYVAVGAGGIPLTSTDGQNWNVISSPFSQPINSVEFGGGRFLAVGDAGFAALSTNGLDWVELNTGIAVNLKDVIFAGEDTFVTVGTNAIATTDDFGSTWDVTRFSSEFNLNAVASSSDRLVAVGDSFLVLTSTTNGSSWQVRPAATTSNLNDVTFGADRFLAVGSAGGIFTSNDGITWTARDAETTEALNGVTFTQNVFVAVGDAGVIRTSGTPTTKAEQTINFAEIQPPATGSSTTQLSARAPASELPISFYVIEGNATITNISVAPDGRTTATLNLSGNAGNVTVRAIQEGNANFYAAPNADRTLSIPGESQVLADLTPPAGALGFTTAPIALSGESQDSNGQATGLDVLFDLVSGAATISNGELTLEDNAVNTNVIVRAYNEGSDAYLPLSQNITYNIVRETATITFEKIPDKLVTDQPFQILAQTSNGEDVKVRIVSGSELASLRTRTVTDIGGNNPTITHTVTLQGGNNDVGEVTIEAYTDSSNDVQAPAVTRTFTISRFKQEITFAEIGEKTFGDAPFNVSAVASGGGEVTITIPESQVATYDPVTNEVTITGAGTVTLTAEAAATSDFAYGPAEATLDVVVAKASQNLQFEPIADQFAIEGRTVILRAQTFINDDENAADPTVYPIAFSVVRGNDLVRRNDNGTLTLLGGQGQVTIQAAQAGDRNVNAATAVQQSFAVSSFGKVPFTGNGTMEGSTYGNGRYVSVGQEGFIFRSQGTAEPRDWEFIAGPTTQGLYDVTFGKGTFVAVGFFGTIMTSTDGANWSLNNVNEPILLNSVAYGDDKFVAVASGGTGYTSPDGKSWSLVSTSTVNPLDEVAYGTTPEGLPQFVAVGPVGTIVSSSNGSSWTVRNSGTQLSLNGIAYGDGMFVIVADRSTYLFSEDGGVTWQRRSVPTATLTEETNLRSIAYGATSFRVVGPNGLILSATPEAIRNPIDDEENSRWVKEVSVGTQLLRDVTFGGDRFVTVGDEVTILISLQENGLGNAVVGENGYRWSDWMGWLYGENDPWFYHLHLGWIYVQGPESSLWMYAPEFGWMWTSKSDFPFIFFANTETWYYYEVGSVEPRLLYNTSTNEWESY